jgi:hypothetical protein
MSKPKHISEIYEEMKQAAMKKHTALHTPSPYQGYTWLIPSPCRGDPCGRPETAVGTKISKINTVKMNKMNSELKEKMRKAGKLYYEHVEDYNCRIANRLAFDAGARTMYKALKEQIEWVSVEDRLPEHGNLVLVKSLTKGVYVEIFYTRFNKNITHWRKIGL